MPCLSVTAWRVYPRGCGGTNVKRTVGRYASGLSPRVRGNRGSVQLDGSATGSIPAGAGEPAPMRSGSAIQRVYPRGCGGTHSAGIPLNVVQGLSPRVRGNLCLGEVQHAVARSIPAGAGEPDDEARAPCFRGVYPRGCGGTVVVSKVTPVTRGLSPRVRGNLMIEALAFDQQHSRSTSRGLSPRVRGNPSSSVYPRGCGGSGVRVYPRGCGGTVGSIPAGAGEPGVDRSRPRGLSPRVRGNLMIEASRCRPGRVYPRGCGGTRS